MLSQKRLVIICIATTSLFTVWACQSFNNIIYSSTPIPNGTLQPISNYDGDWQGTTSQNLEITFTVTRGEVIALNVRATLAGSSCITIATSITKNSIEPTALATGNFAPTNPIQNNTFAFTLIDDSFGKTESNLTGVFSSHNTVSGTFEYTATGTECDGTIMVDWTANKTTSITE